MKRYFLGWDKPFISLVVEWLWECRDAFSSTLLVVPTTESGRKVRQALAEKGPCFTPQVYTSGKFGTMGYQGEENLLLEQLVWEQTLLCFDWDDYSDIMSKPRGDYWQKSLAEELRNLRTQTGEYGYSFQILSSKLNEEHPDRRRWQFLADLESSYCLRMKKYGAYDSFQVRNGDYAKTSFPPQFQNIIFVGVTDPTEQAVKMACACGVNGKNVSFLISAPELVSEGFDDVGRPVTDFWANYKLCWPGGESNLHSVLSPKALPHKLFVDIQSLQKNREVDFALGMGDKLITPYVKKEFERQGIHVFDPAGDSLADWSFVAWYKIWVDFAKSERIEDLKILLRSPWTQKAFGLTHKSVYLYYRDLEMICQSSKPYSISDLWHLKKSSFCFSDNYLMDERLQEALEKLLDLIQCTKVERAVFKQTTSVTGLRLFLEKCLKGESSEEALLSEKVFLQLEEIASKLPVDLLGKLDFSYEFLSRLEKESIGQSREDVHLEALGWLELSFEPSSHLLVTGLNEGVLPNTDIGDSWLPDSLRQQLGMRTAKARFAHDVFYLNSLLEARRVRGSVQGYFFKYGEKGDPLLPSRLILQVPQKDLATRAQHCFREESYSVPGQPWTRDWTLKVPPGCTIKKLSATTIREYLNCPFRFYLKCILKMQRPDNTPWEWSAREFGSIIHKVVEQLKSYPEMQKELDVEVFEKWCHEQLDLILDEQFADTPPLAFRIQRQTMRQRLSFFAESEMNARSGMHQGWQTTSWEEKFSIMVDGIEIAGVIDRVDKHEDGRIRLIDYKTGRVKGAEAAHIANVTARTNIPPHIQDTDLVFMLNGKNKYWKDLQLPLYALSYYQQNRIYPELKYCIIGDTKADNYYSEDWAFTPDLAVATENALKTVISQIDSALFWPPKDISSSSFDEFKDFCYGYCLSDSLKFDEPISRSKDSGFSQKGRDQQLTLDL